MDEDVVEIRVLYEAVGTANDDADNTNEYNVFPYLIFTFNILMALGLSTPSFVAQNTLK